MAEFTETVENNIKSSEKYRALSPHEKLLVWIYHIGIKSSDISETIKSSEKYRTLSPQQKLLVWIYCIGNLEKIPIHPCELENLTGMDKSALYQRIEELEDFSYIKINREMADRSRDGMELEFSSKESKDYAKYLYQLVTE